MSIELAEKGVAHTHEPKGVYTDEQSAHAHAQLTLKVQYNFETPYLEGSRVERLASLLKCLAEDPDTGERFGGENWFWTILVCTKE